MARKRKGRIVDGVLIVDKPSGLTSNAVLQRVKTIYFAQKAGHTGSLDPLATGILPICFGEATKFSAYLLNADKAYRFTLKLGRVTSTGDAEGEVLQSNPVKVSEKQAKKVVKQFVGTIEQIPPMYSALKINGQTLYKLARQGVEVERKKRQITIYQLDFIRLEDDLLTLEVHCSKGTYVRTLAEDIGAKLGCGASVEALRRIYAEPFSRDDLVTMDELEALYQSQDFVRLNALLLPVDSMLMDYPEIVLDDDMAYYVQQGQAVQIPGAPLEGKLRLYNEQEEFIGMGRIDDDGKVCPDRLLKVHK